MEMESSRRPPFDRSRELVSKKPRLSDESNLSGRQFQQPPVQRPAIANRFREKEPEDSVRGSLQQQQQQQQHQELVNQYKTALAELTFNSKPIITNLTIIAGENLQAAKAIAATICSNIIEVPSEQKLPSLYLLDSIVKNIGRDYIKCFAAKLPEVFCKAYRQVDPSIHNGMRHLFGTWKGVFPAQALQLIEKELGFSTAVNGSSSGTTISKSDSQSQRQPHSIHVNPKYLEARQRLQQSSKMKGTDIGVADVGSVEDERTERTAGVGSERPWIDPSMKNVRPQREALRESCLQKQGGGAYGDFEFAPGLSRPLGTSGAKPSERVIGQKWIGSGREVEDSISSERNGYDVKRGIPKYSAGRPAISSIPSVPNKPRISAEISRSWKNSEEEEYMWDDLGTKGTDSSATAVLKKEIWSEDPEKVELGSRLLKWQSQTDVRSSFERELLADSLSCEQKEQVPFGHPRSSHWKTQELNQADSSNPLLQQVVTHPVIGATLGGVPSLGFPTTSVTASVGPMGRHPSPGRSAINQRPPSPSLSKRDPRQNLIDKDHMRSYPLVRADPRSVSSSGQLNTGVRDKHIQDSMPQLQNPKVQKLQPSTLLKPPSPTTFHPKHHVPSSEQLSNSKTELSDIVQKAQQLLGSSLTKDTSSESVNPVAGNMQGQSNVSSLLAAVMKSGLLSGNSVSGQVGTHPSATTISSPSIKMSSKDATTSSAPCDSSATVVSLGKLEKPPLVPRVSSSPMNTSAPTPSAAAAKSNPLSILSTLISKGLISAPKSESAASVPVKSEDQLQGQSPTVATVTTDTGLAVSKVSANLFDSSTENVSSVDTAVKRSDLVQSTKEEVEDLIGFEFRPRLLRDLHPAVIDKLCDNLPHRCTTCGLRFKLQERLARHSEWHAFKNSIPKCLNKPIRRWYSRSSDWIAGKAGFPFGYNSAYLTEGSNRIREDKEKIVPADESQCVCLLCGELFEDFYSQERDEWMFRGAVYLSTSSGSTEGGSCSDSSLQNLIVHANCMSGDSGRDLGLIRGIKVEKGP